MDKRQKVTAALMQLKGSKKQGPEIIFRCLHPERHTHGDKKASASWNESKGVWKCHGCDAKGGINALAELLGIEDSGEAATAEPQGCTLAELAKAKGLKLTTLQELGWEDKEYNGRPAVYIPDLQKYRISLNGKPIYKYEEGTDAKLYGEDVLPMCAEEVWLVEGETDYATCYENSITALGVPGATSWQSEWAAVVDEIPHIFIWQEPDKGGYLFAQRISQDLPQATIIKAPPEAKDINELAKYGELKKRIEQLKEGGMSAEQQPTFEKVGNTFRFYWPQGIEVSVSRVKQMRGDIQGEVCITTTLPTYTGTLTHGQMGMNSMSARRGLIRELSQRCGEIAWADILNTVTIEVLKSMREGEPVIKVGSMPDCGEVATDVRDTWQGRPFIFRNEANLFYGTGGSCKSTLVTLLAILLTSGHASNNLGLSADRLKVLYLDWETQAETLNRRIVKLNAGMIELEEDVTDELGEFIDIEYRRCYLPLVDDFEAVQQLVADAKSDVVICDSVGMAIGGELEKADPILGYFRALRGLGCTTISVDHTNKEGIMYGNAYKEHLARTVWEVKNRQQKGSPVAHVGLFHKKVNEGGLCQPMSFTFTWSPDSIQCKRGELAECEELAGTVNKTQQIAAYLSKGPKTGEEIARDLDMNKNTVYSTLDRGKKRGVFVKLDKGNNWGLATYYQYGLDEEGGI